MLESVDYETFQGDASKHFIVVELNLTDCIQALNLGEKNEGVEVVVRENQFLQLRKLPQLVEIGVVDDEVKADIVKVHFFDKVVEFCTLKDFQCVSINVKHFIGFNLGMATLDQ